MQGKTAKSPDRPKMARIKQRLAAQEARLRADEFRYVKAGILRPEEVQFADVNLLRSPRVSRARSREGRPAPSRKRSLARSSSRSADSGDEGPSDEPPPRRLCSFCGKDIPAGRSPRALYCSDRHADRDRQRRKRQRDRERAVKPRIPTTADLQRMLELTAEELARLVKMSTCRCNGRHQEFEPGECHRCGHSLPREMAA